jgi:AraC family transcriptional activator FtrA
MDKDKMPQDHANSPQHCVVLLGFESLRTFEFGCAVEIFGLERPELGVDWYQFKVCGIESSTVQAIGGISVTFEHGPEVLDQADTIILPGWRDVNELPPEVLVNALKRAHERGARICSICTGAFVLAAAGLLNGRAVTTHWHHSNLLSQRYPSIRVSPSSLYIEDGNIVTSAGSAAGLDMMLYIVRQDYGYRIANLVAQRLVIPAYRDGEQLQVVSQQAMATSQTKIAEVMDWVRERLSEPHSVDSLASHMDMTPRTFQRTFKSVVGLPVIEWLTRARVDRAKELLVTTSSTVSHIAYHCGFASESTFRHQFRKRVSQTPTEFRCQSSSDLQQLRDKNTE